MKFTNSELEMIYQYAAPTKEENLAGLKEIVPVIRPFHTVYDHGLIFSCFANNQSRRNGADSKSILEG